VDSLITAAARALAAGDLLGVLKRVGLREDAHALALRGIAMAQLGDYDRAKDLLRRAARAFGARAPVPRARCIVAEAEIALVSRDLGWPPKALAAARATLERHGDRVNAAHACHLEARRLLLIGRLDEAERTLATLDSASFPPGLFPPALRAAYELAAAGIALRRVRAGAARRALDSAARSAHQSGIAALMAEVEGARALLEAPAARLITRGRERLARLEEVEAVLASGALVVDACRGLVGQHLAGSGGTEGAVSLARRPVLLALARALGESWPGDLSREALLKRAFRARQADESHRARLRVEIGRLRAAVGGLASVSATPQGFALEPCEAGEVVVLVPPVDERHAAVIALLADGEAWASSALALALGASARTVQRALEALAAAGKVQSFGRGRARRWTTAPLPGFTTTLLLPGPLPGD